MHPIQEKILNLSKNMDISKINLRQIGKLIGEEHPQKIKHHIMQLEKKGLIVRNATTGSIKIFKPDKTTNAKILNLAIVGSANCGPATIFAGTNIEGFMKISSNVVHRKSPGGLFIIRAVGNSLNKAKSIEGGPIEDGDYVVVDSKNRSPRNGNYVLSVVDDVGNLKRFYQDKNTGEVSLVSESTSEYPPIVIHPDDFSNYMINGVVVRVIKKHTPAE